MGKNAAAAVAAPAPAETASAAPAAPAPVAPKAPRGPAKSFTRNLYGPTGDRLEFIATVKADETVGMHAVHRVLDEKGKTKLSTRGASAPYANLDAAKVAIDGAVTLAKKAGWSERERKVPGGFVAKPDAFTLTSLPKPNVAA